MPTHNTPKTSKEQVLPGQKPQAPQGDAHTAHTNGNSAPSAENQPSKPTGLGAEGYSLQAFMDHLHRGGTERYIFNADTLRSLWVTADKPFAIPGSWKTANIYFGVHPTNARGADPQKKEEFQRSTNKIVTAINCFFTDFDGKEFTFPTEAEIAPHLTSLLADPANANTSAKILHNMALKAAQEAKYDTDPTHYKALAFARLEAVPVPASVIVDTGGGYHAYWLLTDPFYLRTEAERKSAASNQKAWALQMGADTGAGDLARCLRFPGTRNRKKRYAPDYPLVKFVKYDLSLTS